MQAEAHSQTQPRVRSKARRLSDNIISVSLSVCITSPFVSLLPRSPSPPLPFCLSLSTGIVGKQVENYSERTDIVRSLCYVSEADQWAWVRRYAQLLGDNGESVDYCLCGNEVNLTLGRSCTVSPSGAHTQCLSSNCALFSFRLIIAT